MKISSPCLYANLWSKNQIIHGGNLWSTFRRHHDNLMAHISYRDRVDIKSHTEVGLQYLSKGSEDPNVMTEALLTFNGFPSVGWVNTSGRCSCGGLARREHS